MPINSKQKGARFERQLASKFRDYGYVDSRRTAQYCGNSGDASDVIGLPGIHIEAKHQEKMYLYDWMDQAKRDSEGTGNLPAVFHKKNNHEILVTMPLDSWMQIYKELEVSKNNNWIPCSERLPEELKTVIACTETYGFAGALFCKEWHCENMFCYDSAVTVHDEVVAWQPLPKPYKEGD